MVLRFHVLWQQMKNESFLLFGLQEIEKTRKIHMNNGKLMEKWGREYYLKLKIFFIEWLLNEI